MNLSWIFIILGAIMWGVDGVLLTPKFFSYGLYNVVLIVFIIHLLPTLYMFLFKSKNNIISLRKFYKEDIIYLLLISIFGGTLGTISIVKALELSEYNPYSLVILVQKLQPIFAILSAYIILKEKFDNKFKKIFLISLISLYFLTFGLNNPFSVQIKSIYAIMYSLLAAISFGLSTTFSRKVSIKYNSDTITYYRFSFTSIITFIILLFNFNLFLKDFNYFINNKNIILLSIFIASWGLIAAKLYYIGLKNTKAIYSTICELAFPITSVLLDIFINNNYLDIVRLLAAFVLILSILYLNIDFKKFRSFK